MSKIKKSLFKKIKFDEIVTTSKGKKVLIVDRQRFASVIKNYCAIKILQKKNPLDIEVLTDLDKSNEILKLYNQLGSKKTINSLNIKNFFLSPTILVKTFSLM